MTEKIEHVILESLVGDEDYTRKVLPFLDESYFDTRVDKLLFGEIKEFFNEHNKPPSKKVLELFVDDCKEFKQEEYDESLKIIRSMEEPEKNKDWLVKRTEKWAQEKAIYNAIRTSIGILDGRNTKLSKEGIPSLLQDALAVSFDKSVGHDYFGDAEKRYEFYHLKEDRFPFDLTMFNKITKGGIPKKTLSFVVAGVNVGKSLFLCHMAASAVRAGKNALYITMEMAEERIAERVDCNLLDIPIDNLYKTKQDTFKTKIDDLREKTHGTLVVKEYPTGGAHVGHFKALLNELEMKRNFKPDVVFVDYLNICTSQRLKGGTFNSYTIVKSIAEELRGMAVEYDIPVITATQFTRSASTDTDSDMTGIAECLDPSSLVIKNNGDHVKLLDVNVGDKILGSGGFVTILKKFPIREKTMFKITTKSGKTIICSDKHKFPTKEGRISIRDGLEEGVLINSL
jgi:replicative DNA helicase